MKIVNLTPHELRIETENAGVLVFDKAELPARLTTKTEAQPPLLLPGVGSLSPRGGTIIGSWAVRVAVACTTYGDITGLPDPEPNTVFVTSLLVAQAAGRPDVMSPGELMQDEVGNFIACKGLAAQPVKP